jgi:hypothetical protein
VLPQVDTPTHPYIGASPACWARHGRLQARAYEEPELRRLLQVVVDTYAVQHPGVPGRRQAQSVALHLMTLCLVLEDGADPRHGSKLHKRMVGPDYDWLEPPEPIGTLTTADVESADDVLRWAREVWEAWSPHHETVRRWIGMTLG